MPPDLAPMIVATVLIVTVGFVVILRPIMKPLVRLFEAMIREREQLPPRGLAELQRSLDAIGDRLHLIEERQGFYEALLTERRAPELLDGASTEQRTAPSWLTRPNASPSTASSAPEPPASGAEPR